MLDEEGELAHLCVEKIVNIFYLFSKAENYVKETVAERSVLKSVLKDLDRMSPPHQIIMLKFVKNLSMLSSTLDTLQNANAIEVLTDFLVRRKEHPHYKECSNQILNTMYNMCKLSKSRQEEAATNGIIPILQNIVKTERPLKEFALPVLCDMAHASKVTRRYLWQCKGLEFYISLLSDANWAVTAMDAIQVWLSEETARVEEKLLALRFTSALIKAFLMAKANNFESLLDPIRKIFRLSPALAASAARSEFLGRILQKLSHNKAIVRMNLLHILGAICDASEHRERLLRQHGMLTTIQRIQHRDQAVLVRNLAEKLVNACIEAEKMPRSRSSSISRPPSRTSIAGSPLSSSPTKRMLQPTPLPSTPSRHLAPTNIQRGPSYTSSPSAGTPRSRQRNMSNPHLQTLYFDAEEAPRPLSSSASSFGARLPKTAEADYPTVFHTPGQASPVKRRITRQRTESLSESGTESESGSSLLSLQDLKRERNSRQGLLEPPRMRPLSAKSSGNLSPDRPSPALRPRQASSYSLGVPEDFRLS